MCSSLTLFHIRYVNNYCHTPCRNARFCRGQPKPARKVSSAREKDCEKQFGRYRRVAWTANEQGMRGGGGGEGETKPRVSENWRRRDVIRPRCETNEIASQNAKRDGDRIARRLSLRKIKSPADRRETLPLIVDDRQIIGPARRNLIPIGVGIDARSLTAPSP